MSSLPISPLLLLFLSITATVIAFILSQRQQVQRQKMLKDLARKWGMQYSQRDLFNLATRIAGQLPLTGASDVRVRDLIYGSELEGSLRCLFSAEYTVGVVRSKCRKRCVVSMLESPISHATAVISGSLNGLSTRDRSSQLLAIAPESLPLVEQYESLRHSGATPVASSI